METKDAKTGDQLDLESPGFYRLEKTLLFVNWILKGSLISDLSPELSDLFKEVHGSVKESAKKIDMGSTLFTKCLLAIGTWVQRSSKQRSRSTK